MYKHKLIGRALLFVTALCILAMGFIPAAAAGVDETEILKITIGDPTQLSTKRYQNSAVVAVSRIGTIAAFFTKTDIGEFYRISTDAGRTWGKERTYPWYVGPMSVGLREGGVLNVWDERPVEGSLDQLETNRVIFTDDFLSWENKTATINMPNYMPSVDGQRPNAAKGPIIQLPSGNLLMPMYGGFEGDDSNWHRSFLVQSIDQGRNWDYYATIDYTPNDPHPELPGLYISSCEPSVVLLPNGQMLAMLRRQYNDMPWEYKPMYVCWSNDLGRTWTTPKPTEPHLMNISPTLAALDNGVLACQYGRPGFHVAFSLDHGHTWKDRVSLSHLPEPYITGQFNMIKAGPNNLVAIGSDVAGVKVWPIFVKRVKVSPSRVILTGRVVNEQGRPISGALVERGPNRYSVDDWVVDPVGWNKRILQFCQNDAHPGEIIPIEYLPQLSYRSIQKSNGYPTARTDEQGRYVFKDVDLGEYVLTVECDDYAPTHRHVNVRPQPKPVVLTLQSGQLVRGQVVDVSGRRIGGVCVVLDQWHCHTDPQGYFHWSVKAPVPQEVTLQVYKKYSHQYGELETTVALSQLESEPITLKNR